MKSKLAVFDFDHTIKNPSPGWKMGVSHFFPGGEIPEDLHQIRKEQGWDKFVKAVYSKVSELGLTKENLHDGFANNNGTLVDGIDKVLKKLHETDHDLILISDSLRVNVDDFLKKNHIFELFEEIFCQPAGITDDGKITTSELPKEWGGPCLDGGRNLCKGSTMKYFCEGRSYDEIKYFGDGGNDLCPALSLSEKDTLYPRRDYRLAKLLSAGDHEIKAKILLWNNGSDIMKSL